MDPLCGMTRAVRAMARGNPVVAFQYNPGAFMLAVGAVAVAGRWAIGRASGRWVEIAITRRRLAWCAAIVGLVALEINQQFHAARLR